MPGSSYKKTIVLGLDYSEFEGGMKECNSAMKSLDAEFALMKAQMGDNASASDKLSARQDYLTQKINLQKQKVEEAKKKYDALMSSHADTSKIEKADIALLKERTTLQNLSNELDDVKLKQSGLKESATLLVGVVTSVATAFLSSAKAAAEYADNINTISQQVGVSKKTLQEWEYASDFIDTSFETMTGSLTKLEKSMMSASNGSGSAADAFKQLGIKITDSSGNMKNAEDVFYESIDALGKIKNATEQDQLAMAIFGKSATELTGVIDAGSDGLKAYGEEAEKLGRIMSDEEVDKAQELNNALDKMSAAFESLKLNLGSGIIPVLTDVINAIASIPTPVLKLIVIIGSVIATIVTLASTINSVVQAGTAISGFFSLFNAGIDSTYVKIVGIIAIITALVVAITVLVGKGKELNQTLSNVGAVGNTGGNGQRGRTGHNASGTQSWRGGATWVGEHGPEIVDVPAGARIYNNNETKQMGNTTYNISMNCDLSKMRSVADVVNAIQGIGQSAGCGV